MYGTPRRILTDQGCNFESEQLVKFCNLFRVSNIRTSAYHPQFNGICKRFNRTLKHSLAQILSKAQQISWNWYLSFAIFSYNLFVHSSTGFKPVSCLVQKRTCRPISLSDFQRPRFQQCDPCRRPRLLRTKLQSERHIGAKNFSNRDRFVVGAWSWV